MCHSAQASAWSEQRPIIVEMLFDFFLLMAQNGPQVNRQKSMKTKTGRCCWPIKSHSISKSIYKSLVTGKSSMNCSQIIAWCWFPQEDKNVSIIKWRNFRKVFLDKWISDWTSTCEAKAGAFSTILWLREAYAMPVKLYCFKWKEG